MWHYFQGCNSKTSLPWTHLWFFMKPALKFLSSCTFCSSSGLSMLEKIQAPKDKKKRYAVTKSRKRIHPLSKIDIIHLKTKRDIDVELSLSRKKNRKHRSEVREDFGVKIDKHDGSLNFDGFYLNFKSLRHFFVWKSHFWIIFIRYFNSSIFLNHTVGKCS